MLFAFAWILPVSLQDAFGGLLILSLGIVHGANDIALIRNRKPNQSKIEITIAYIGVVVLGAIAFFFIPGIALLFFVLVSTYHFGEQHWNKRLQSLSFPFVHYTIYGSVVFATLFYFHQHVVYEVVKTLSGVSLPFDYFSIFLSFSVVAFGLLWSLTPTTRKEFLFECLVLGLIVGVFARGSLLYAFGSYFVVWHSFPSLKSQMNFLYAPQPFGQKLFLYLKSSFWYWSAALLGLLGVYLWIDFSAHYFLPLFFTFLAAITFPHVVVMHRMFHTKK